MGSVSFMFGVPGLRTVLAIMVRIVRPAVVMNLIPPVPILVPVPVPAVIRGNDYAGHGSHWWGHRRCRGGTDPNPGVLKEDLVGHLGARLRVQTRDPET